MLQKFYKVRLSKYLPFPSAGEKKGQAREGGKGGIGVQ